MSSSAASGKIAIPMCLNAVSGCSFLSTFAIKYSAEIDFLVKIVSLTAGFLGCILTLLTILQNRQNKKIERRRQELEVELLLEKVENEKEKNERDFT